MSSTMMPSSVQHHLVDDVVREILLRLPPASVLRFRAVCKHWRSLISCPSFLAAYSLRLPLELLAYPDGYKTRTGSQNVLIAVNPLTSADHVTGRRRLLRFDGQVRLLDCQDGLLLFETEKYKGSLVICNPATRQWVGLPRLTPDPCWLVFANGLYFHGPSGEHRVLCIGSHAPPWCRYDATAGRYRYDAARKGEPHVGQHYYVLSTGAARPRQLGPVAVGGAMVPSACLAIGGTLHWSYHAESRTTGNMVAFDTVSETFRLIAPPPPLIGKRHHVSLFDMDGTLALSAITEGSRPRCMDVWALEDGEERWTCRYHVDLPPQLLPGRRCSIEWPPTDEAVAVVEDGRVLVVVGHGWVVLYDMKDKRTVSKVDHTCDISNITQCLYRPSLVPLPEPHAQRLPFCRPWGGEPLLQYCPPDDPYLPQFGSEVACWVVPTVLP